MNYLQTNQTVRFNEEGYLEDLTQWDEPLAEEIASNEGIKLSDRHWEVIRYLQEQYRKGSRLSIRSIGKSGLVNIKEFYTLFPDGPLKKAARIAGIPKPASCI